MKKVRIKIKRKNLNTNHQSNESKTRRLPADNDDARPQLRNQPTTIAAAVNRTHSLSHCH